MQPILALTITDFLSVVFFSTIFGEKFACVGDITHAREYLSNGEEALYHQIWIGWICHHNNGS
jgi:hypothetical protein